MATRESLLAQFSQGVPKEDRPLQILCEDQGGTYIIPYPCEWTEGAWRKVGAPARKRWSFLLTPRTRRNGFMSPIKSDHLTAELCRAKAKECLYLAEQAVSRSQRIMLEHIAETWHRIADAFPANDA
jgi:hypothetical protein